MRLKPTQAHRLKGEEEVIPVQEVIDAGMTKRSFAYLWHCYPTQRMGRLVIFMSGYVI